MPDDNEMPPGYTEEQWARLQEYLQAHPFGDQDENGIDLSLLRNNLKKTPSERLRNLEHAAQFVLELKDAGAKARVPSGN